VHLSYQDMRQYSINRTPISGLLVERFQAGHNMPLFFLELPTPRSFP
jgi:hypothetical protein